MGESGGGPRIEGLVFPTKLPLPAAREDQDRVALLLEETVALEAARLAAERQLEAIAALPAAALREFFSFANGVHL